MEFGNNFRTSAPKAKWLKEVVPQKVNLNYSPNELPAFSKKADNTESSALTYNPSLQEPVETPYKSVTEEYIKNNPVTAPTVTVPQVNRNISVTNTNTNTNIGNTQQQSYNQTDKEMEAVRKEIADPNTGRSLLEYLETENNMPVSLNELVDMGEISEEVKQNDLAKRANMMRNYNNSITGMQNAMGGYYYNSNYAKEAERQKLQKQYIDDRHIIDKLSQISDMRDFLLEYELPIVTLPLTGLAGTALWEGGPLLAEKLYDRFEDKRYKLQEEIIAKNPNISEKALNREINKELFSEYNKYFSQQ